MSRLKPRPTKTSYEIASFQDGKIKRDCHESPVTSHQPSATNHQSLATSHLPPVTNHQPPVTSHESFFYGLLLAGNRIRIQISAGEDYSDAQFVTFNLAMKRGRCRHS